MVTDVTSSTFTAGKHKRSRYPNCRSRDCLVPVACGYDMVEATEKAVSLNGIQEVPGSTHTERGGSGDSEWLYKDNVIP